jgi:hypothetical protein
MNIRKISSSLAAALVAGTVGLPLGAWQSLAGGEPGPVASPTMAGVQRMFYTGRYDLAATSALALRTLHPDDLDAYEIRTAALHFQLRAALGENKDPDKAFKQCVRCPELLKAFLSDTQQGVSLARARLRANPKDDTALFFLGKLDLNYVWLELSTLGRRTGWNEYWEARRSLDAVLKRDPRNVRARVARAWIDYIVDTKMTRGTRWLLGGGSRKRALAAVQEAASTEAELFAHTEAEFGLWDMLIREKNFAEATVVARRLAKAFPENREVAAFLKAHDPAGRP